MINLREPFSVLRSPLVTFNKKKLLVFAVFIALLLVFTACEEPGFVSTAVTGVSLNRTTLALTVGGGTETLTATVEPSNADNKALSWSSGNTSVATVDNGTVTAVGAGTTTVTVTTVDGGFTADCTVSVTDPNLDTVATPSANPPAGQVASGTAVTLSTATASAEIWYTTNGNVPMKDGTGSTKYSTAITITAATTIKAIAVKDGMNNSAVLVAAYTVTAANTVAQPVANPAAGWINSGAMVSLSSSTAGAEIWYTINSNNAPAKNGTDSAKYTTPIAISAATTIKAIAVKDGMSNSTVLTAAYTINQVPIADDFTITGIGTFAYNGSPRTVTVVKKTGKTDGTVTVYYNGSPTAPSAPGVYPVTFNVAAATGFTAASGLVAGTLTISEIENAIGVQFTGADDEVIDLTLNAGNNIPYGQDFTVTVSGDYDYYVWYIRGNEYDSGPTMNTFTIGGGWLYAGIHTVTAVVIKNNVPYSKELIFKVVR